MKGISGAVQALMASGQYVVWDLYTFTVAAGTVVLNCHDADFNVTIGATTYQGGLIFNRGVYKQSNDMAVQTMSLTVASQYDYPGGPPTINGYSFVQAVRQGLLDAAIVNWNRLYLPIPTPNNYLSWPDLVTYAPTAWGTFIVTDSKTGRQKSELTLSSLHELLNIQMPRNLVSAGCAHMVYDAGCTLNKTSFTTTYTVGTGTITPTVLTWGSGAAQVDHYYDLGVVTFTGNITAALAGVQRTVRASLNAAGQFTLLMPLPVPPASGDTFTATAGCDKTQNTCSTKFSNIAHFRGMPYVPVPETLYEGTATAPAAGNLQPLGPPSGPGSGGRYAYKP